MELTEANLRQHNDVPSGSSSPSPRQEPPATQMRRSKEAIVFYLRSLRRFGSKGLQCIDDADVCIDDKGAISFRGCHPPPDDDAVFWTRRAKDLQAEFHVLLDAVNGPPPKIIIDHEAQKEQDRIDDYHASWKRKMQLWLSDHAHSAHIHASPPSRSNSTEQYNTHRKTRPRKRRLDDIIVPPPGQRNKRRRHDGQPAPDMKPFPLCQPSNNTATLTTTDPSSYGPRMTCPRKMPRQAARPRRRPAALTSAHGPRAARVDPPRTTTQASGQKSANRHAAAVSVRTRRRSRRLAGLEPDFNCEVKPRRSRRS